MEGLKDGDALFVGEAVGAACDPCMSAARIDKVDVNFILVRRDVNVTSRSGEFVVG